MKNVEFRYYTMGGDKGFRFITKCDKENKMVGSGNCQKNCKSYVGRNDKKMYIICAVSNGEYICAKCGIRTVIRDARKCDF